MSTPNLSITPPVATQVAEAGSTMYIISEFYYEISCTKHVS